MLQRVLILFIILAALALSVYAWFLFTCQGNWCLTISTFEDCQKQGFPVTSTQPRQCVAGSNIFTEHITPPTKDPAYLTNIKTNEIIESPLILQGQARGSWFFEASFPIRIIETNNRVLGEGIAQAQGEWMTRDYVPFTSTIEFKTPGTNQGFILLIKDNPSGLPEHDAQLRIPVRFNTANKLSVQIFLGNTREDPQSIRCDQSYPLTRIIPRTTQTARAAIEELLKGPTGVEEREGYFTSINKDVKIQSLTVEQGIAKIDFDSTLEQGIGGSCRVTMIRSQIIQTLTQFSSVKKVIISINGRTEDILQP